MKENPGRTAAASAAIIQPSKSFENPTPGKESAYLTLS